MKVSFPNKISDKNLSDAIIKSFPEANIVHISRSGEQGTIEISGLEDALKNNITNIISSIAGNIPDVKVKAKVEKIITREELKQMNLKTSEPEEEEDSEDIPAMDFTGLLNAQINAHVKKAKKSISILQDKFNAMVEEYNVNSGGFSEKINNIQDDIKRMQDIIAKNIEETSIELNKMQESFKKAQEETISRIVGIENRFEKLDSCIENMIKIFSGIS